MREEDEIRAAVIALAEAQAAGEDIADPLPHGEAWAATAAASDEVGAEDALDPEQAREEAIAAVLDAARAASRASRLSCPCEWEAAGLVPPSMTPEDLEMAVYDALMEFGDPNGSRDAADIEGPDAGAAPRRAANKHVKSAFSSSNGRPVGASPFKRKAVSADAAEVGTERSAKAKPSGEAECVDRASSATEEDVRGAGGCPDRASSAANETAQWAVSQSEDCLSESRYRVAVPQEELQPSLPSKLVANLPYAVAATVVLDYFESFLFLDSVTIMVQKEVADRMAAAVGTKNYGAYTVKLGLHAEPAGRFPVGPGNFFPPPRVDSAVIRLNRRVPLMADGAPATPEVIAAAALVADAAFANRRKTIANSCKTYFSGRGSLLLGASGSSAGLRAVDGALSGGVGGAFVLDGADIVDHLPAIFDAAAIDPRRRGETLTQQEFLALGAALLKEATV